MSDTGAPQLPKATLSKKHSSQNKKRKPDKCSDVQDFGRKSSKFIGNGLGGIVNNAQHQPKRRKQTSSSGRMKDDQGRGPGQFYKKEPMLLQPHIQTGGYVANLVPLHQPFYSGAETVQPQPQVDEKASVTAPQLMSLLVNPTPQGGLLPTYAGNVVHQLQPLVPENASSAKPHIDVWKNTANHPEPPHQPVQTGALQVSSVGGAQAQVINNRPNATFMIPAPQVQPLLSNTENVWPQLQTQQLVIMNPSVPAHQPVYDNGTGQPQAETKTWSTNTDLQVSNSGTGAQAQMMNNNSNTTVIRRTPQIQPLGYNVGHVQPQLQSLVSEEASCAKPHVNFGKNTINPSVPSHTQVCNYTTVHPQAVTKGKTHPTHTVGNGKGVQAQAVNKRPSAAAKPQQSLPPSKGQPVLQKVPQDVSASHVFFDLETTSLRNNCDITQIAASHENETFSEYVIPTQPIDDGASMVTGLTFYDGTLFLYDEPVDAKPVAAVLQRFLEWLKLRSPALLFAHNARFDYVRLFNAVHKHNLQDAFQEHIVGFVDTLGVFRRRYPGRVNYKQETLVRTILKQSYGKHNATEDVRTLQKLYKKDEPHATEDFSCTFMSAFMRWQFDTPGKKTGKTAGKRSRGNVSKDAAKKMVLKENLGTFDIMKNKGYVSQTMAKKIANSGLCLTDLKGAFKQEGVPGLFGLLTRQNDKGQPRVTKSKNVIVKIGSFFEKENCP